MLIATRDAIASRARLVTDPILGSKTQRGAANAEQAREATENVFAGNGPKTGD
jgi:hypothetical protein